MTAEFEMPGAWPEIARKLPGTGRPIERQENFALFESIGPVTFAHPAMHWPALMATGRRKPNRRKPQPTRSNTMEKWN
jgi:hypothetical protein